MFLNKIEKNMNNWNNSSNLIREYIERITIINIYSKFKMKL